VPHPVVVELDRELRALDAERLEECGRVGIRLDDRNRLLHTAEDDAAPLVAIELDRDDPAGRFQPNLPELERRREDEGRTEGRVTGEGDLGGRGEDPDPRVPARFRGVDEDRLGEVDLAGQPLELLLGEFPRVGEDGHLIARERRVGEDVGDDVAKARHVVSLSGP
jgi:hypothetical protein